MDFLEAFLEFVAQLDDGREIDFVEGGEDGGGLLGVDQRFGDALADFAHRRAVDAGGIVHDRLTERARASEGATVATSFFRSIAARERERESAERSAAGRLRGPATAR